MPNSTKPRNNRAKLDHCRELLGQLGCDVGTIKSRRQLNWMIGKLTRVKFDWLLTESEAFTLAWPSVEAALLTLASDPNLLHAATASPELHDFFPGRRPVTASLSQVSTGNVVDLAAWREKRRLPQQQPLPPAA